MDSSASYLVTVCSDLSVIQCSDSHLHPPLISFLHFPFNLEITFDLLSIVILFHSLFTVGFLGGIVIT